MEHADVVTLFHEFGHLVHHVLGGGQRWARFSGVATEWDFVEAPSQMLEEWAWDADVLQTFATDADGEPIPRELVARMRAAQRLRQGPVRADAAVLHGRVLRAAPRPAGRPHASGCASCRTATTCSRYIEGTHFHASFGHLAGYTSAYYTYLWSLVIAKDLFSAFDPADLSTRPSARRYRDAVLAPGGSRRRRRPRRGASSAGRSASTPSPPGWTAPSPSSQGTGLRRIFRNTAI